MKTNSIWGIVSPLSLEENYFQVNSQQQYELLRAQNTKALNACGAKHKTQASPSYGASRPEVESLGKNKHKALILFP